MNRTSLRKQKGLTLIELMIVLALIGMLLGIAIPTYQSYQTSVRMAKTSVHFDEAVRLAKTVFAKEQFEMSVGKLSSRPYDDEGWVELFTNNGGEAALGGPAFVASVTGDSSTGAIGVVTIEDGEVLLLIRPEFFKMVPVQARIDKYTIEFSNL
ncbi:MAG: prepilin-type N-terminal cleavage/methylation domain-containing protein [Proteobacteria bacterium]|nr:prepilin-type N-terminal cleavage/methylation domain-containing protein [Pseudomonadota bacterium]